MMEKRGQLTVFILLVIVLVIVFGFMFYFVFMIQSSKTRVEAEKELKQAFEQTELSYSVQSCLDKSLERGLFLVGQQGGVIFKSQGGPPDVVPNSDDFVEYTDSQGNKWNVSLWLKKNPNQPATNNMYPCYSLSSAYCSSFSYVDPCLNCPKFYSHLNQRQISFGDLNKRFLSIEELNFETWQNIGGFYNSVGGNDSIEFHLESFVETNFTSCLESVVFPPGVEFVELNQSDVVINFFDVSLQVIAVFNFTLGGESVLLSKGFFTKQEVALFQVVKLLEAAVSEDMADLNFFVNQASLFQIADSADYPLSNTFSFIRDEDADFSIIGIKDSGHLFQLALEERRPALNSLTNTPLSHPKDIVYNISDQGNNFIVKPFGLDPDDSPVRYHYSCPNTALSCLGQSLKTSAFYTSSSLSHSQWESSCVSRCANHTFDAPANHTFIITLRDRTGSFDAQTVHLQVVE